jgi:hypothetical protein
MLQSCAGAVLIGVAGPVFATVRRPAPWIDPDLLERALGALDSRRHLLANSDILAIVDFARPSAEERFYIVDVPNGIATGHLVAHGRGSDPRHSGYLDHFSNDPGSEASSAGAFVTGDYYQGKYGRSLRLAGLDRSNSNASVRNIVVHSAPYAEPSMVQEYGKLGRSEGCFALARLSLKSVLEQMGPGHLIYAAKLSG